MSIIPFAVSLFGLLYHAIIFVAVLATGKPSNRRIAEYKITGSNNLFEEAINAV